MITYIVFKLEVIDVKSLYFQLYSTLWSACREDGSDGDLRFVSDLEYDVITPNRLKLGRNNSRSHEGSMLLLNDALLSDVL